MVTMNYIGQVLGNKIVAHCSNKAAVEVLLAMGAKRKLLNRSRFELDARSKEGLACSLESLRDAGFLFAGGSAGWPPSAVFEHLRDEGWVKGKINVVTWKSNSDPVVEKEC